jgi:hypothetical protein
LLLVTDPSRYDVLYDEWGTYTGLDNDVAHINGLAARFGLVFQPDYLYNTLENEGNYRNIRLTDFAPHPLTEGLEQVVLVGTHSIASEGTALVWAAGDTRSSSNERAGDLTVAALSADGQVLGVGDLSFLLEPYNTLYDNDQFVANIADLLASAERRYELDDFPFFFEDEVDLVYAGDPPLDGSLLAPLSSLQEHLDGQGLSLTLQSDEDAENDTILLGLYEDPGEAEPYLTALSVTLTITPAGEIGGEEEAATEGDDEEVKPVVDRIQVDGLGEVVATGNALLALQEEDGRRVLLLLAGDEDSLSQTVQRLTKGDLAGCLFGRDGGLAICPAEEKEPSSDEKEKPQPEEKPSEAAPQEPAGEESKPAGAGASIMILSLDAGEGRYDSMTGVDEFQSILEEDYEVSTWSTAEQGLPEVADLQDYDVVIWTAGDFEDAFGEPESGLLFALMLEDIPVLVSGAYIGDATERAVQRDIQVKDASHPLAQGFDPGEVITFVDAPSGEEYEIDVLSDLGDGETDVVFVRGPESESEGLPSIAVVSDAASSTRVVFAGLPIYLLPEEARARIVLNAVAWMLTPAEG